MPCLTSHPPKAFSNEKIAIVGCRQAMNGAGSNILKLERESKDKDLPTTLVNGKTGANLSDLDISQLPPANGRIEPGVMANGTGTKVKAATVNGVRKEVRFNDEPLSKERTKVRHRGPRTLKSTSSAIITPAEQARNDLSPLSQQFYTTLLFLIHFIYIIYYRCRRLFRRTVSKVWAVLYYPRGQFAYFIRTDARKLRKRPQHLAIILADHSDMSMEAFDLTFRQICKVSGWCYCAGINSLTLYERSGILKQRSATIFRAVQSHISRLAVVGAKPSVFVHRPHALDAPNLDQLKAQEPDLIINCISESDGRESLVDLTRTLAEMAQLGRFSAANVSQELIDAQINGITSHDMSLVKLTLVGTDISEPDLLISFGPDFVLQGFPPWQLRLTELLLVLLCAFHFSKRC